MKPVATVVLLAAALALALTTVFIVVPAPHRRLAPLGVGAPEVSPWLAVASLVVLLGALAFARHGGVARLAAMLAGASLLLALTPLARAPFATRRFDAAMTAALGADPLRRAPRDVVASLRPASFVLADFVRGFRPDPAVRAERRTMAAPEAVTLGLVIYRRPAATAKPGIVQIYGGAWQRGAPEDDEDVARMLASLGYVVFAIDYRHAPASRWPAAFEDVRAGLQWVRTHGGEHGADVTRLALFGRSAGAHLALLTALADHPPGVRAVVSFYGPTDLADGWRHPPSPDPLDARSILETFIGGTPDERPDAYRDASPIAWTNGPAPPTLFIHGARDHIVESRFSAMLDERLRAQGQTSLYLEIPWAEHAFDAIPHGVSGQIALYYTERFLAWALHRE
jgi:acetyl esterase/lipase